MVLLFAGMLFLRVPAQAQEFFGWDVELTVETDLEITPPDNATVATATVTQITDAGADGVALAGPDLGAFARGSSTLTWVFTWQGCRLPPH
jgi:hypothetical protein